MNKYPKKEEKSLLNQEGDGRVSMPNLIRPKNVFKVLEEESTTSLNDRLMKYKEFKMIYKKTKIQPVYFFYSLIICLVLIFIGFLESYLTLLISTLYPLYISIKSVQGGSKDDIKQWLTYWYKIKFLYLK